MPQVQQELPGMSGPRLFARSLKNARFCRNLAHKFRKDGQLESFHTWMKVAHRSIASARRLASSGVASR